MAATRQAEGVAETVEATAAWLPEGLVVAMAAPCLVAQVEVRAASRPEAVEVETVEVRAGALREG